MNIPVIALCDTHNNLKYVDVAIPCNNNTTESISMIFWMLAREVLMMRGELEQNDEDWNDVMVDLFYHKNLDDLKKAENEDENLDEDVDAENDDEDNDDRNDEDEEDQDEGDWQNPNN